jgi:hypothetical protein
VVWDPTGDVVSPSDYSWTKTQTMAGFEKSSWAGDEAGSEIQFIFIMAS